MGACCKPEEYAGDDATSTKSNHKILFLGSGGCGKSTLFKQLRQLYGTGFTNKDKKDAVYGIAEFVVETMRLLLEDEKCNIQEFENEDAKVAANKILEIKANSNVTLTAEISAYIKILWQQQEIKDLFDETARLQLNGPCAHFFDSIDRISSASFEPSDKDILMQRRPTTGLIEQWIADNSDAKFQMVDVGGQKNERRKWIHHFENVSAIVYVVSLSAYNELLYEDETVNSLRDAIDLFAETIKQDSHWFKQSSLFLIFNKKDLFNEKILTQSLSTCFDDDKDGYDEKEYFGNCENEEKIDKNKQFIKDQFIRQITDENKQVLTFETCAYEPDQVTDVFDQIFKNIVSKSQAIPP